MPAPSLTSAQNVSSELGGSKTTTSQLSLNWANVRNIACKTGSGTQVSYANCRFGINFPGGTMDQISYAPNYDVNNELYITSVNSLLYDGFSDISGASGLEFFANGVFRFYSGGLGSTTYYHRTWLTSGVNSDYTVQFNKTSGNAIQTGATSNTDLAMSTDRVFYFSSGSVGPAVGAVEATVAGNIIVKDTGGTLISRPFSSYLYAEITPN